MLYQLSYWGKQVEWLNIIGKNYIRFYSCMGWFCPWVVFNVTFLAGRNRVKTQMKLSSSLTVRAVIRKLCSIHFLIHCAVYETESLFSLFDIFFVRTWSSSLSKSLISSAKKIRSRRDLKYFLATFLLNLRIILSSSSIDFNQ